MKKANQNTDRRSITDLQQIINIGPSIADDLRRIKIQRPSDLIGRDAFDLHRKLCEQDQVQHDPCVIDCFMSAIDFMNGNPPRKWWHYTPKRKLILNNS